MKTVKAWLPALVWMGFIFFFSNFERVSVSEQTIINFLFFKTLHLVEYAVLFVLYLRSLHVSIAKKGRSSHFVIAFVLTIVYAITDEMHQTFVPTREGRVRDVIIDAIGAGIAWYGLRQLLPEAPKRLRNWAKLLHILS